MRTKRLLGWCVVIWAAFGIDCGGNGSGDGGVINPALDVSGQWDVTYTVTSDTCGGASGESHSVLLTQSGNAVAWQDEGDACDPSTDFMLSGGMASQSFTGQFTGFDGCTYREDIAATLSFTSTAFSGTIVTTYTRIAGSGCVDYASNPCEIRETVSGARCQGCYGGCQ